MIIVEDQMSYLHKLHYNIGDHIKAVNCIINSLKLDARILTNDDLYNGSVIKYTFQTETDLHWFKLNITEEFRTEHLNITRKYHNFVFDYEKEKDHADG